MVHLASNESTELLDLGGDWDLSASISTQRTWQNSAGGNDGLVPRSDLHPV